MAYPLFHELGPRNLPAVMSVDDFHQSFHGEDGYLEFKQGLPETKIREAVTAFSNSEGGVVLLGVRDDGVVTGLEITGETEARLHRMIMGVRDAGRYFISVLPVADKAIAVVAVYRRRDGFAQLQDGRILVRRGAMNTPIFGEDLTRFVAGRALNRFESTPAGVPFTRADVGLIEQLARAFGWSDRDVAARLSEAGLVEGSGDDVQLTVAGTLYLTPKPAEHLGKTFIEIFRYRGETTTYDNRVQLDGPLDRQVEAAVRHLTSELGSDVVVLGLKRHDLPRVPENVLREVIANALAHRVYENANQPVRVDIRPDHVSITSPGGLPEPVTLANMREQSSARNLIVIRVLRRLGLAEDAGMGVDVIEDSMEAALLEKPVFSSDGTYVRVDLPIGSTVSPQERAWIAEVEERGEIRSDDRLLLLHAARGEALTNTTAREALGVDSTHARTALHRLRDLGYLAQSGSRGGATYTLARTLNPPAGLQLDRTQLEQVVLALAVEGAPITNEMVRDRTGLDRIRVLRLLNDLLARGELERRGERRGTAYSLPTSR